jgi:hypothetical protein
MQIAWRMASSKFLEVIANKETLCSVLYVCLHCVCGGASAAELLILDCGCGMHRRRCDLLAISLPPLTLLGLRRLMRL